MARIWMRTTQHPTWRQSSTTYMGPHISAKLTSQMPTINLNLTKKQKNMHNQHFSGTVQDVPTTSWIEKLFFNLPELHRIKTQRYQRCCDLSRRCLAYGTIKEQLDKRMLAVKSRLREKNFTNNEKKSNSKQVNSVNFLEYSISKEGIATDPKHVEKTKMKKHQLTTNNHLLG